MNGYASNNIAPSIRGVKRVLNGTVPRVIAALPSVIQQAPCELTAAGFGDVLAKPVSRAEFIIAKMLGILTALTLFSWVTAIATLIALRMATDQFRFDPYLFWGMLAAIVLCCLFGGWRNYMAHRSFPASTALALLVVLTVAVVGVYFLPKWNSTSYEWKDGFGGYNWRLARALILIMFAVWAMGTLATALSTRLNLMSNLTVCAVVFVVGLLSRYVYLQLVALKLEYLERWLHSWFYGLVPFLAVAWILAAKHYHQRQNARLRLWEVHAGFGLVALALAGKGVYNYTYEVSLQEPAPWMKAVAKVLLAGKDAGAAILYALVPNWQNFWLVDVATKPNGNQIPAEYIGFSLLYILLFVVMFTVLALLLFAGREVGRQEWQ